VTWREGTAYSMAELEGGHLLLEVNEEASF
jgi:hypothetical protein